MGIFLSIFLSSVACFGAAKPVSKEVDQNPYYQYYKAKVAVRALEVTRQEAVLSFAKIKYDQNTLMRHQSSISEIEYHLSESDYLAAKAMLAMLKQKVVECEHRLDVVAHRIQNNLDIPIDTD